MLTGIVPRVDIGNPYLRTPPEISHWTEVPDEQDMKRSWNFHKVLPKRNEMVLPIDDGTSILFLY